MPVGAVIDKPAAPVKFALLEAVGDARVTLSMYLFTVSPSAAVTCTVMKTGVPAVSVILPSVSMAQSAKAVVATALVRMTTHSAGVPSEWQ